MGHKGMCKRWLIKVTLASGNRGPAEDYEWVRHFESTMLTLKDKSFYEKKIYIIVTNYTFFFKNVIS